jgi:hypothetical protein
VCDKHVFVCNDRNNLCAAISIGELGEPYNKRIAMIGPFTLVGCFSIGALGVAIIRDSLQ